MSPANNNWKAIAPILLGTLGLIGFFYWDTFSEMSGTWWRSQTYTHGFVVPIISAWLIWQKRPIFSRMAPVPAFWPVSIVAAFALIWLIGELTAINALTQFSLVAIIVFSVLALLGPAVSKELAFPLGFLFFAVPIGDFLLPNLMEWTADFTVSALRLSNIPVYREGQSFVIPSGHWSVVEACSGIRYMIASVTVGTLYAYLTYTSLRRRLTFVLISFLVPLIANWLRAYLIVMLGHLSGNKLAVGVDHLIYGWIFFGVVIAIMFAIGMRWSEPPTIYTSDSTPPSKATFEFRRLWPVAIALAITIIGGPVAENALHRSSGNTELTITSPSDPGGWLPTQPSNGWKPRFVNPSSEYQAAFNKGDQTVGIYVAYYRNQNYGHKLVTSTNVLVMSDDPDWQSVTTGKTNVEFGNENHEVRTAELLNRSTGNIERYVAWRWYRINGQITANDIKAKLLTALSILSGHGDDGAAIVLYAPKSESSQSLPAFARDALPQIHLALDEIARK